MNFSSLHRATFINQLQQEQFDVLVIGGGITGVGIALDAISRGLTVALIDMQDFQQVHLAVLQSLYMVACVI